MNNLTLVGRLGSEPVIHNTEATMVARISLGVNMGTEKEDKQTEWFDVCLWDKLAYVAQQYLHTGDKVYIKGHLSSSNYEDKEGNAHHVTQIVADEVEKLSTAKRNIKEQE
jgi:single-strand DNA-binding protein